jgi:2Fe-2S ferredoxin
VTSINFLLPNNETRVVRAGRGETLMHVALHAGIKGVIGECGGNKICGTCHIYVAHDWLERLGPLSNEEDDLLEFTTAPRQPNSRLACQIPVGDDLDGLGVQIPPPS